MHEAKRAGGAAAAPAIQAGMGSALIQRESRVGYRRSSREAALLDLWQVDRLPVLRVDGLVHGVKVA